MIAFDRPSLASPIALAMRAIALADRGGAALASGRRRQALRRIKHIRRSLRVMRPASPAHAHGVGADGANR
jgi:hypothetical protein